MVATDERIMRQYVGEAEPEEVERERAVEWLTERIFLTREDSEAALEASSPDSRIRTSFASYWRES